MEEKRRIRLRWRRLVCYLLILLAAASCYIVLRSYLLLMVVLLLVGVLAVSVYGACLGLRLWLDRIESRRLADSRWPRKHRCAVFYDLPEPVYALAFPGAYEDCLIPALAV